MARRRLNAKDRELFAAWLTKVGVGANLEPLAAWLTAIGIPANGGPSPELVALSRPELSDNDILWVMKAVLESGSPPRDFLWTLAELMNPTPGRKSPFGFRLDVKPRPDAPAGEPKWQFVVKRT